MSAHAIRLPWPSFVARRLGVLGWAGVLLLVLAVLAAALVGPALRHQDAQARVELAALRERWAHLQAPADVLAARDPVAAFASSLPPSDAVPDFLAQLQKGADLGSVQIDRTEYRIQPALGGMAERIRMNFPAHVDYLHLRRWLEHLLHDHPSLTLDDLNLHRASDGGDELDAHIGLSLIARRAGAEAAR